MRTTYAKLFLLVLAIVVCTLLGDIEARSQDLKEFCNDLKAILADAKKSHPEWPIMADAQFPGCIVLIEAGYHTDAMRLMSFTATVLKTPDVAAEFVAEYRTRTERYARELRKLDKKRVDKNALFVDLTSKANGWQDLERFDYNSTSSVLFGRYDRMYVQIVFEKFPYVDIVQNFLLNYRFDQ